MRYPMRAKRESLMRVYANARQLAGTAEEQSDPVHLEGVRGATRAVARGSDWDAFEAAVDALAAERFGTAAWHKEGPIAEPRKAVGAGPAIREGSSTSRSRAPGGPSPSSSR